jgi:peptidoglycan hydrolase-like protein with peptidoglycan-binding domain
MALLRRRRAKAALVAAMLGLSACSGRISGEAALTPPPEAPATDTGIPPLPATTSPVADSLPTTSPPAPPPVTAPAPPPPVVTPGPEGLLPGYYGPAIRDLQERLAALKYDPGARNGRYGPATALAVMAFQKVTGKARTGKATPDVLAALATATDPPPMLPDGGPTRVEVDFARQVLLYWRDGALVRILPVSTGNGRRYCDEGQCGMAVTPSGSFRIERRILGLHKSHLGVLYNPLFFSGGYAIHGSPSVPAGPASHGCVRIPMHTSRWFYDNVPNHTPVYLIGGKNPAVPLGPYVPPPQPEPASPPAEPAPAPQPAPAPPDQTPAPAPEPAPQPAPQPAPEPAPEPEPEPAPSPAPAPPLPSPGPARLEPGPARARVSHEPGSEPDSCGNLQRNSGMTFSAKSWRVVSSG